MSTVRSVPPSLVFIAEELEILEGLKLSSITHRQAQAYKEGIDSLNRVRNNVMAKDEQ